ncbi:MAG: hypothetical protein K2N34_08375 [Lachnospiraceae bacterium]|nr:hypothetical protein [Lachnospiraceae bacterium]
MRIALYGMPCAGKTTLMETIPDVRVIHGSRELKRISGGSFSELSEEEKFDVRVKYTEYIKELNDRVIISDGHYSFQNNVVFTEADGNLYDVFIYLYCSPKLLLHRYEESEKNTEYAKLSPAIIEQWQNFEIASLRFECHKRGKDFYVVSDGQTSLCRFTEFINYIKGGYSSYKLAKGLVREIRAVYPEPCELSIVDGDKTIIIQDSFRYCCNGTTSVFDGNFYTGYQSFLFQNDFGKITPDSDKIKLLEINETIFERIRDKNYIVLSSGITELWNQIGVGKKIMNVFANPMISADTKYFVVKILRNCGYKIVAYGDSKNDFYMLQEADAGFLYIGDRLSSSLRDENMRAIHLIYNMNPYILADENDLEVMKDIDICKSNSGVNGSNLAAAHFRLGQKIGKKIGEVIPKIDTAILVLERGGRFFGDGLYSSFGGTFYAFNSSKESIPVIDKNRIIIVDSVINTGKSILEIIGTIKENKPDVEIIIASNVIQQKTLALFRKYKVFAVRVSENSFVGKRQAKQAGDTGPDTADRLFNLIES